MRRNPEFVLCDVSTHHVLMPTGKASVSLNGMVTLNDMGVVIWNLLEAEKTEAQLLDAILERYEVAPERAQADIAKYLEVLRGAGALLD